MLIFVNCAQLTNLSVKSFGDEIDQTKNTRTKGGTQFLVENKGEHKDSATKLDALDQNLTKLTEILDQVVGGGNVWDFSVQDSKGKRGRG